MSQAFQRNIEDFRCEHCGENVKGDGYTNHCPECLFSKHVDIRPGDRAATCGGLMEPTKVEPVREGYRLLHRCLECGYTKNNKTVKEDNIESVLSLSKHLADKKIKERIGD